MMKMLLDAGTITDNINILNISSVGIITNDDINICTKFGVAGWGAEITIDRDKILGKGAYGTVYVGRYEKQTVAVKAIFDTEMKFVRKEIDALKTCSHKNVLHYYASERQRDTDRVLIALELCQASLRQWVKEASIICPAVIDRLKALYQATQGLAYLHKNRIVHQDLKPENILLKVTGYTATVKIADFGISKFLSAERSGATITSVVGTDRWRAPEILQFIDQMEIKTYEDDFEAVKIIVKRESDIFTLGLVFFFVITRGKHPFGKIPAEIRKNVLENKPVLVYANIPEEYQIMIPLISQMMSYEVAGRPSADFISNELHRLIKDYSSQRIVDLRAKISRSIRQSRAK